MFCVFSDIGRAILLGLFLFFDHSAYFLIIAGSGLIISRIASCVMRIAQEEKTQYELQTMRITLTKYGLPQAAVFPAAVVALMIICILAGPSYLPAWSVIMLELLLTAALIGVLSFFRDPYRPLPLETDILLAPADGTITDVETINESDFICGPALRIGIFLSIFDAHINRAPCNVKIEKITYKKGKYKNAANPQSGRVNEANSIYMTRTDNPPDRLIVRQISGAIARRIVCRAGQGGQLTAGEKFGMIKFGSRTELYLPMRENVKSLVKKGDKVKAGLTPLIRYEV